MAEGQLEEAKQRYQKAMSMENTRNPGASRAMLEYCQVRAMLGQHGLSCLRKSGGFNGLLLLERVSIIGAGMCQNRFSSIEISAYLKPEMHTNIYYTCK